MKHQPMRQGWTTTPGITCCTLFDKCVGSLTSSADHITLKMLETGPMVYSPYLRRLECLTICRCNYKGSTLSSVIGDGQNTDPQSIDYSNGLPKWTTLKWTTPKNPTNMAKFLQQNNAIN